VVVVKLLPGIAVDEIQRGCGLSLERPGIKQVVRTRDAEQPIESADRLDCDAVYFIRHALELPPRPVIEGEVAPHAPLILEVEVYLALLEVALAGRAGNEARSRAGHIERAVSGAEQADDVGIDTLRPIDDGRSSRPCRQIRELAIQDVVLVIRVRAESEDLRGPCVIEGDGGDGFDVGS